MPSASNIAAWYLCSQCSWSDFKPSLTSSQLPLLSSSFIMFQKLKASSDLNLPLCFLSNVVFFPPRLLWFGPESPSLPPSRSQRWANTDSIPLRAFMLDIRTKELEYQTGEIAVISKDWSGVPHGSDFTSFPHLRCPWTDTIKSSRGGREGDFMVLSWRRKPEASLRLLFFYVPSTFGPFASLLSNQCICELHSFQGLLELIFWLQSDAAKAVH